MRNAEDIKLPSLFIIGKYRVFFWSKENDEPIHVHICSGKPTGNATKVWISSTGGCVLANNNSRIPEHELKKILEVGSFSTVFFDMQRVERPFPHRHDKILLLKRTKK